jgi:integrase
MADALDDVNSKVSFHHLTVPSVNRLVKQWARAINLPGNYGAHTLRKTFGYHQRVTFGAGIPELMVAFNHSSQRETLDYLCIQPEEIRSLYLNEL